MSKKIGRPKNPRIKAFENKIAQLEKQIESLQTQGIQSVNVDNLEKLAIGCHFDVDKKEYVMDIIKYSPDAKVGKVIDVRSGGDSVTRATFEIKKFIAHEMKIGDY